MKAKPFICSFFTIILFFTISLSAEAQSISSRSSQDKEQLDKLRDLYEQRFLNNLSKNGYLNFKTLNGQPIYVKTHTSTVALPPDNMVVYIPEMKNPDNMLVFSHNYGKIGSVDLMPNSYREVKPGINTE